MTPSEREDLLARSFEGTLDDASAEHLEGLLADPETFRRFRGLAQVHGLLLAREASRDLTVPVMESISAEEPRRRLTHRVMATLQTPPRSRYETSRELSYRDTKAPGTFRIAMAAAGVLFAAAALLALLTSRPQVRLPEAAPAPRAPEPAAVAHESPLAEPPPPKPVPPTPPAAPIPSPPPPAVPKIVPPEPPRPEPPKPPDPPAPPPPATEPARRKMLVLAAVDGSLLRLRAGKTAPATAGAELAPSDLLITSHRRAARFSPVEGVVVFLERGATFEAEVREEGSLRARLAAGVAFFELAKPIDVATPEGEISVTGASFQVARDEKLTVVAVLEGAARFRTEKGEVTVRAGQRSGARSGERPSTPAKADVEALAAWRRRPELSPNPERTAFTDHEPGRRLPGLAIAAPFFEGEAEAGRVARATAEILDAGLVLGHHWRDVGKKRWINVDRSMEAELRADGTPARETFTDRARKATAEYLDHARVAAGVTGPVPMLVQFRNHYERNLEVCEAASNGWPKATIAHLKALYAQLLEKHKPAYRLDMRFQGADDTYDHKGQRRTFFHTEADARVEGYMAPRAARRAIVFFLNPEFAKQADVDAYAKVFAGMIEFLYKR